MKPALSVVVPAYRTGDFADELVDRLRRSLADIAWELVVVDDACPEGSGSRFADVDDATVIELPANVGQRRALLVGIDHARADLVALMDADLQDRPEDLPPLIGALRAGGTDVACAGRRGRYAGPFERATGAAFRWARWLASGGRIPADAGLFLVARRPALLEARRVDGASDDLLVALDRVGATITSIPIVRDPRPWGHSAHRPMDRVRIAARSLAWGMGTNRSTTRGRRL